MYMKKIIIIVLVFITISINAEEVQNTSILEKNDLLDTDVLLNINRAIQLKENIDGLTDIVMPMNKVEKC